MQKNIIFAKRQYQITKLKNLKFERERLIKRKEDSDSKSYYENKLEENSRQIQDTQDKISHYNSLLENFEK